MLGLGYQVSTGCDDMYLKSVAKCRGSWVVGRGRGSWVWVVGVGVGKCRG